MRFRFAALLVLIAAPALADNAAIAERAISDHALPAYERLSAEMAGLADAAATCDAEATRAAYHEAFDAWMGVAHLAMGPAEEGGRMFAIAFWPDAKDFTGRQLRGLIADEDPVVDDPAAFAEQSIAVRGLFAMERLFFDPEIAPTDAYRCRLATAIGRELARNADAIRAGWTTHAEEMRKAGEADAALYPDAYGPARAFFNAALGGLQATADLRLGRPLGSIQRPRPNRAEARRSDRSLKNVRLSLFAVRSLFETAFAPSLSEADAAPVRSAFAYALKMVEDAPSPLTVAVADPSGRLKIDVARGAIEAAREALLFGVGGPLALAPGFNALDGD